MTSTETFAQRRARILLAFPECSPTDFDLAYLFGYEPESWDGMWKLRARRPIIRLTRNWAIAAEVAEEREGHHVTKFTRRGRPRIRYVLRRARDARDRVRA